jgi:type IX secretion system PorP/SprF family membrane protein
MFSRIIILTSLLLSATSLYAQRIPQDALYLMHNIAVNPAYTGSRGQWYAHLYYNRQWWISGSPDYINAAIDGAINNKTNLGFYASTESMGLARSTTAVAAYAYRLPLGEYADLSYGLSAGAVMNTIDFDNLQPIIADDPALKNLDYSLQPRIAVGLVYESSAFFMGFSLRNLAGAQAITNYTEFLLPDELRNVVFTFGYYLNATDDIDLLPSIMLQEDLTNPTTLEINMAMIYMHDYRIGIGFRTEQPIWKSGEANNHPTYSLALGGELFWKRFTLGYNYIIGLNSFVSGFFDRHAISLGSYISTKMPHRYRIFHFKRHTEYCPTCY